MKYDLLIGIDTGVNTGFAIYDCKKKRLTEVSTLPIHQAMEAVENVVLSNEGCKIKVRFEDARQVKFKTAAVKAQGAGYVKAHAQIWEAFLKDKGIDFDAVRPNKQLTKLNPATFKAMTGWAEITSNHARDAAMLIYGY